MRVYLASPFFNPKQLAVVEQLEEAIIKAGCVLYSPRVDGVLTIMTPEERVTKSEMIFNINCREIEAADLILAVIDGRDTGVIWEMGCAYAIGKPIITYTDEDFGLNVMLKYSVKQHMKGIAEANYWLNYIKDNGIDNFINMLPRSPSALHPVTT